MSQAAQEHEAAARSLEVLFAPIGRELAQVEKVLDDELRNRWPCVDEMLRSVSRLGGKRLRPALLLLTGKATGRLTREHIVLAAVVEMIHTATLIHDDVLDEADLRRHSATCNARWDNEAAILLGDYLFTHAFSLASSLAMTYACQVIGRATNAVCEGELRQIAGRGDYRLSEHEYLGIVEAKTAKLCECSCRLGAYYAGADEATVEKMADYGKHLGIAFQITDDLLDVVGDDATAGKSLGTDLKKQKPTLPLIHVLKRASESEIAEIRRILQEDVGRKDALAPWFQRFDAFRYTRQMARSFADRATAAVAQLPTNPARSALFSLPQFVLHRSF